MVVAMLVSEKLVGQHDHESAVVSEKFVNPATPERSIVNAFMLKRKIVNHENTMYEHGRNYPPGVHRKPNQKARSGQCQHKDSKMD